MSYQYYSEIKRYRKELRELVRFNEFCKNWKEGFKSRKTRPRRNENFWNYYGVLNDY